MAAKNWSQFWLLSVTASVGFVSLSLSSPTLTTTNQQSVKHHVGREVDNNENIMAEARFGAKPMPMLTASSEQSYSAPSVKCPLVNMHPCTCRPLAKGIVVECTKPESRNELTNALSGLRTYIISEIKLINLDFEIRNEDFDSMQFISLHFTRGSVKIRGGNNSFSLSNLKNTKEDLMSVHFMGCTVDLGETTLSEAPSTLGTLEFYEVSFRETFNELWFKDLKVRQLRITDSKNITQPIACFLLELEVYQHTRCELEQISKEMFPLSPMKLRRLDFSNNRLTSLPEGIFTSLPNLEEILLTSNRFTTLEQNVFQPVWDSMKSLDFYGNFYLKCEGLNWLLNKAPEERAKVKGTCIDESGLEVDFNTAAGHL